MHSLAAQVTSSLLQFPETTIEALQEDEINLESLLCAKFTTGRAGLAWLACGPQLEVTNSVTGERLSAYCFSTVTERPPTVVTVKEFYWQKRTGLLVGLVESEGSILCLYDVGVSKVVKAVVLPGSVTCVEPLVNDGGASTTTQHLHQSLRWFFGVAAVVTDVGHVLLIDLCLDDVSNNQDELEASDLEVCSGIPAEIPKLREAANRERRHLCLQLLAPSGTAVTTVSYISRTNQLAVGFSDGYLSLWNLKTLRREYHVQIEGGRVPVFSVTFQEPENDPRNCCYLWVVQTSQSGRDLSFHLLQLAFSDRKCLPSGQIVYENLEYCEERYNLDLSANALYLRGQTNSMKLLGCQTIEKFRSHSEKEDGLHDVTSPDTSVSIFSWHVNTYGQNKPSIYIGVFDINRWYQAQMPDSLRPGQFLRNCSYIAFWSLEALTNMTEDSIFDILVHERSLSRGVPPSYPPPEQFYFPSTYNFDATCLLSSGVIHITCTGFQKETLHYLKNSGSSLNEEIPDGYNRCLVAGLLSPRLADVQPSSLTQEEQLQAVLSAAVETSSISLLTRCIKQWIEEEQPRSAPNLRFVLEWTWDKVVLTKKDFDRLCAPLFDGSCNFMDSRTLQSLQHCHLRLSNLTTVLNGFRKEAKELTKQGVIDLTNKLSVTRLLTQYASVVLWFCRCGLLPDNQDEAMQLTRPYYNFQLMQHYYEERRKKLEHLARGKWNASTLMVDNMMCQLGERVEHLWKRDEGGTGKYPPATIHALLDLYLLEDADEMNKHAIIVYFLLDVMYSFPDKPDSSIESFPTAFSVPCGLIKLIQGFWLLDHNDYQNSVDCILHPAASRVMTWQHNLIIETLMCQLEYRQALRYIQVIKPPISNSSEVKLHMTVFLANRHIFEAWNLQKLHSSRLNVEELLKHMYETCQEMGLMEDLLKLTFTESEQDYLHKYLHTNGGVQNQELLLVHHLQRANYIPALQLNQLLKNYHLNDCDRRQRERAVARKSILDQYGKILPSVQQTLASDRARPYPSIIWKKVTRPKPLSTVAKQAPAGNVITEANFIHNVLMKIKEVSAASENRDFSPYRSLTDESSIPASQVTELEMPDAFVGTPILKSKRDSRLLGSLVHPILAEPAFDEDIANVSCKTPCRASVLLTSSPVQSSLLKSTQLKNLSKASEFNLLETPLVVKKAKALLASTGSSSFIAVTPQSILRSSAHTTPLASPSVSPGRSVTPPLRSKEIKISFIEQISKKYTKGILATELEEPTASPVLSSGQETMWAERVAMLAQNNAATDIEEMDESSSGIQDGSPSKMDVSNVSARSDQTTLEFHDAPTPEDLEDELVLTTKLHSSVSDQRVQTDIDSVVVTEDVQAAIESLERQHRDNVITEDPFVHESEPEVPQKLPVVQQDPDMLVDSVVAPVEDCTQATEDEMKPDSSTSVSVISVQDSEDIDNAHSELLDTENDHETQLQIVEENVLIVEEITAATGTVEVQNLNDEVDIEVPEPEVTYQPAASVNLEENKVDDDYCNYPESANDDKDSVDATTDVEDEHSVVPNNFSLVLERDPGDEDYAEVKPLKADQPSGETLKKPLEDSCEPNDENINLGDAVSNAESCQSNLILGCTEEGAKITETLPYMPEPVKVALAENVLDVLKKTRSKDFVAEVSDSHYENESVKKLRNVHTVTRSPVRKVNKTNHEDLTADTLIRIITPPEKSDEQKLDSDKLQTSPSENKTTLIKPPTPRRSVRKTTKVPDTNNDSELPIPTTPKRGGRKAKDNPENFGIALATLQEEQQPIITRISRRTKSLASDKSTENAAVTKETVTKLPFSPARTRRGKAAAMDDQRNTGDIVDQQIPTTPTRITRSSKVAQENENEQSIENVDIQPLVTTPTRGRRGKRAVNELVKQFELGALHTSNKTDASPPVSPKKVSLRWSKIRSQNQIDQKGTDEDNVTTQEVVAGTPAKKSVREVDVEDSPQVAEEQKRTTRLTRTRSNMVSKPETTSVEFVFSTPTPRRRKNVKAEQTAPPVSPDETPESMSSEYMFSPPSLRARWSTRTTASASVTLKGKGVTVEQSKETIPIVPEKTVVKKPRGRPPKHRVKKDQPEDKAAWSPPPVKIQLLSPPESPSGDSESTKPLSLETKAAERNQSRKTRRRIVASKPVTRRKIR
ncbi:protein ELYS isoform X2 [Bufo gargarizans]|uniref:protein ELYS isoform X2 n=1 Tax=Bufo gargarizans TaxID=30331 RepID=UPI001CF4D428|nr:protein ELYS isoform X2 [Bufo gargarizans]